MMKNFFELSRSFFCNLLDLFYPRLCVACGHILQKNEEHLCLRCLLHLPESNYHSSDENPLLAIFLGRVRVESVNSYLLFRKGNYVQSILHQLKYKGNKEIGAYLGKRYATIMMDAGIWQDVDVIIPIPLHPQKMRSRGYNQSEWIAKGLSEGSGIPYRNDCLIRATFTETQTKKSRFNRWENVKNVFAVTNEYLLEGKHVLLCDDVLTTGATLEAAIQKLLLVPGVRVSVVTLAAAK